ncbi:centromere/kinetochore protein zw10 homolog isoform X2 [Zingiber officinale]|uniref:centromere/kinetochore protein zw10 homolog isoform X2 n=1 Tax=Zingiber officinale TaxID=94328 RepID=UPI001C4C1382|nr:centromere/kinetochore protein zw10 homolog isoform X2 [Zingiber officinale]
MDVLSGSIDVRELLPGDALDESSPLSVPDLRLLIDRLQIRSLSIKDKVRSYVLAHRDDFYDLFSRCSSASSSVEGLSSSLSDALGLLSDRPLDLEIEALVSEIRDKRRELVERREALEVVRTLSAIHSQLTLAREDLKGGRLVAAAEAIRNLRKGMIFGSEKDEGGGFDEPAVYGFLRKDWSECFDELQDVLAKNALSCVQYEPESSKLIVRSLSQIGDTQNVELRMVLEAMGEDKDGSFLYSRLRQIVNFVYRFICFQNADWMQCFGKLTWPRMSDLIIIHFLSKAVPDAASKVIGFQNIVKCSAEFETFLKEMKLIQSTDSNEEKLSHYAHNVEVHFASRKRNEILARSRSLLLQFNYDLLAVSDVGPNSSAYITDLLFQSDKCIVSKAVLDLMELVHGALKDACLSPARVAKEFYHAARDALLLYKAVIPIKLGKQLDSISQVAIVIYNECQYLSEEVLGLAYEYRTDFPSALQKQALFLDIALNFHQIAENILQKQVHLVSVSLREAIDGADGFQNTHQPQHYESAKFSIEQIVFIVEKARIMWERLLPASTYKRTMCTILDSVFSEIARDLLLLDDLAAEETLQLQRLIQITIENLSSLLESLIIDSVEKQNFLNEATWTHLDEKIPSLPKFRKLADLYDMPLKSITLVWESGELLSCGFTSCEIENFVKAIFADSPLRKECLQRIRNASD